MPITQKYLVALCFALSAGCTPEDSKGSDRKDSDRDNSRGHTATQPIVPIPIKEYPVLKGDFDGDGKRDEASFVLSGELPEEFPPHLSVVPGWNYYGRDEAPDHPRRGSPVSLAIQQDINANHSLTTTYVVFDPNEISILSAGAAYESTAISVNDLPQGRELPDLPEQFLGDIIVIPSEAGIDTYLYWNGETYTSHEPLEIP